MVYKTNVRSTMQILSICLPFLRLNQGGSVSVLSSSAGEKPWPGHTIYNSVMASLNMMVRCAALENAQFNVRINAVAPGFVESHVRCKFGDNVLSDYNNRRVLADEAKNTPLLGFVKSTNNEIGQGRYIQQICDPIDAATQMLFLASYQASFMNGEVLVIDGGMSLTSSGYKEYAIFS